MDVVRKDIIHTVWVPCRSVSLLEVCNYIGFVKMSVW